MTSDTDENSDADSSSGKVPLWLWPNLLSLDAPLVAVAWQWWFALCLRVKIPGEIYATLGLTVWIIYVADRLYDGYRLKSVEDATPRHRFYRKYATPFLLFLVAGILLDVWLVLNHVPVGLYAIDPRYIDFAQNVAGSIRYILSHTGFLLGVFVLGYFVFRFLLSRRPQAGAPREIMCGFIFALGTLISVYFYSGEATDVFFRTPQPIMLAFLFSANCIAIAHWEAKADLANEDASLASTVPTTGRDLPILLGVLAVSALYFQLKTFPGPGWPIYTAIFLSALGLLALKLADRKLSTNALRVLADAVLIAPMIPLVLLIA